MVLLQVYHQAVVVVLTKSWELAISRLGRELLLHQVILQECSVILTALHKLLPQRESGQPCLILSLCLRTFSSTPLAHPHLQQQHRCWQIQ